MTAVQLTCAGENRATRMILVADRWFRGKALYKTWDRGLQDDHLFKERYTKFSLHLGFNPDAKPVMDVIRTSKRDGNDECTNECLLVLNPGFKTTADMLWQLDTVLGADFIGEPFGGIYRAGSDNIPWSNIREGLVDLLTGTQIKEPCITPDHLEDMRQEIRRRTELVRKAGKWFARAELNPRQGTDPEFGFERTYYSVFQVIPETVRPYFASCFGTVQDHSCDGLLTVNLADIGDPAAFAETITRIFMPQAVRSALPDIDAIWNGTVARRFAEALRKDG